MVNLGPINLKIVQILIQMKLVNYVEFLRSLFGSKLFLDSCSVELKV